MTDTDPTRSELPVTGQTVAPRIWVAVAGLLGASGVVVGALLAHLGGSLDGRTHALAQTALEMQMWHALALLGLAALRRAPRDPGPRRAIGRLSELDVAGAGFTLGTLCFCGAVYATSLGHPPGLPVAPVGGTLLILSWLALAAVAIAWRI